MTQAEIYRQFLDTITEWAGGMTLDRLKDGARNDFDSLFEDFLADINDAVCDGIQDGMDRWSEERPLTRQDISDNMADEWYTMQKERESAIK